jgi:hypothetical protein
MEEETNKKRLKRRKMKFVNRLMATNSPSNLYTKIIDSWDAMHYRLAEI